MSSHLRPHRRAFLKQIALAGAAPFVTRNLLAAAPGEKLRHASIGGSGQAADDLKWFLRNPAFQLVAVADVDLARAATWKEQFPDVKIYQDWRELLDQEKNLDSLNVTVPDHMHAAIALSAMQLGKHVYVQKPLAHDVFETRRLTEYAREKKLVTQMGIQIHSEPEYLLGVHLIQGGTIGKVREVHTWCSKKWGDLEPRPDRADPVPEGFNWDSWLGTAAARPFLGGEYYHPGNWRKRLDFGTGTFGDMGCHIFDPVFKSLALTAPLSVRSEGPMPSEWNWANNAIIHYVFPGTAYTTDKTVSVHWYDGDEKPPADVQALLGETPLPPHGSIFIGEKGVMLLKHIATPKLFPEQDFTGFVMPKLTGPNHYNQFIEACRGNGPAPLANFDYAGPLTETVLLGGVATRFPHATLEWNAAALQFANAPEAGRLLRRPYRSGWEVKGLV